MFFALFYADFNLRGGANPPFAPPNATATRAFTARLGWVYAPFVAICSVRPWGFRLRRAQFCGVDGAKKFF